MTEAAQSAACGALCPRRGTQVAYAAQDYRTGVRMRFLLNDTLAALHYLRAGRIGVFCAALPTCSRRRRPCAAGATTACSGSI